MREEGGGTGEGGERREGGRGEGEERGRRGRKEEEREEEGEGEREEEGEGRRGKGRGGREGRRGRGHVMYNAVITYQTLRYGHWNSIMAISTVQSFCLMPFLNHSLTSTSAVSWSA